MGMRGKKKRQLNQEQKRQLKAFNKWIECEIEKELTAYLKSPDYKEFQINAILNGTGVEQSLKGLLTQ